MSLLLVTSAVAEPRVLVDEGKSGYRIVITEDAPPSTRYAAEELQRFVRACTGAELPIVDDTTKAGDREILLGASARLAALDSEVGVDALGEEGYVLRTIGPRLVITGGEPRGTLYGVYQFLEDQLGCRWFTPSIRRLPKTKRWAVPDLDLRVVPPLEYREVMLFDAWDADWMARNRVNTTKLLEARHGGAVKFVPGYYVHTFHKLVPPAAYFEEHPEYFSEVDGQRLGEGGQLCCTNDDVIEIATEKVLKALREHPEAKVISVSQTDGNDNYCRCERCAALDEKEGSHAAQVLYLVNRVAEAVEREFPDQAVVTLAYEWSLTPPETIRPRDNVIVRLSTIRCDFSTPLGPRRGSWPFHKALEGWHALSDRIWVWDYTTYFSYYLLPWPNYRVMDDNLRYFVENGVTGVVEQHNWQSRGGAMAPLKAYLLARFLWKPDADEAAITTEFLEGVYGAAAPPIQGYLDLLAEKVEDAEIPLKIYGSRTPKYLTLDVLQEADALWERAAAAVADQPELLTRVQQARLSLDYAYIEHFRWQPRGRLTYAGRPGHSKVTAIAPDFRARVERFLEVSKGVGITHIREGEPDEDAYVDWLGA